MSLQNRTPPQGSLSAELLGSDLQQVTRSIMSNLKDVTGSLSEFNSCVSDSSDSEAYKKIPTKEERKRKSKSPGQKEAPKKVDLKITPGKVPPKL